MLAPLGKESKGNVHAYILTWIYKINKIFDKEIDLTQAAAKFSIIFIFLSIILAYFIGLKNIRKNRRIFFSFNDRNTSCNIKQNTLGTC